MAVPTMKRNAGSAGERREAIKALAHRFWSIHPREIQDMGVTREEFYEREMTKLLACLGRQKEFIRGGPLVALSQMTSQQFADLALALWRELRDLPAEQRAATLDRILKTLKEGTPDA